MSFLLGMRCFRYHKGTDFQANHNCSLILLRYHLVVLDTTKVQIFKQITTIDKSSDCIICCFRYHKGTDFQANHNCLCLTFSLRSVVLDTTKVQIFKQITTRLDIMSIKRLLFQIPQRYRFSSKSQRDLKAQRLTVRCFRYHKGTDFQANHNASDKLLCCVDVVLDTTKVQIFKQITTYSSTHICHTCCFRYHKGTDFQANHNMLMIKKRL